MRDTPPDEALSTEDREPRRDEKRPWWLVFAGAGAALTAVASVLAQGDPPTPARWIWLGVAALGAIVSAIAIVIRPSRTALRVFALVSGAAFAAVLLVLALIGPVTRAAESTSVAFWGCDEPVEVRVLVPDESAPAFAALAARFAERVDGDGCRPAHLTVYSAAWPRVRKAFAEGWTGTALRDLGPRPDVWIAESLEQYGRVAADAAAHGGRTPLVADPSPFAYTPLVLGVPNPRAESLTAHAGGTALLSRLRAAAGQIGLPMLRPDPALSYTGLRHTEAMYRHETDARVRRDIEQRLGAAADQGGYPLGDEATLLCHRRAAPDDAASAAVYTTEQALVRYNAGRGLGASCPLPGQPRVRLTAFYPAPGDGFEERAESLDYTLTRWTEDGGGYRERRREAVDAFAAWLGGDEGRGALLDEGLRPADGQGGLVTEQYGARGDADYVRGSWQGPPVGPLSPRLDATLTAYLDARRETAVLLAVDVSGSMGVPVDADGRTGLQVATSAVSASLALLGPRDRFGLWTFPGDGDAPYTEVLPVASAPDPGARAAEVAGDLAARSPGGRDSPVYRTVTDGIARLTGAGPDVLPVLVVFTDGADTTRSPGIDAAVDAAASGGVRVFVVAVGEASCLSGPLSTIAADSGGACVDAEYGTVGARLGELFGLLWGGADAPAN
ncbi:hypothetical protein Afil01_63560 [Actinorhabdospora filicis]|uniref:VWFA domain-containing protein n=1 Tax=Actinorhabdospora filicis TaxID=1785913 RepID=A0A9W6ST93_9ACTN|nr:vWA domain-containing protein [Actinorhabdospora filicis]GLZ81549.1 hypothetical protein Afil01_63560 [Actinorhabdospora filicis]